MDKKSPRSAIVPIDDGDEAFRQSWRKRLLNASMYALAIVLEPMAHEARSLGFPGREKSSSNPGKSNDVLAAGSNTTEH